MLCKIVRIRPSGASPARCPSDFRLKISESSDEVFFRMKICPFVRGGACVPLCHKRDRYDGVY